ncbi:MAG: tetratricopeptide repeat protein [Patescibacteria group bacterium]
MKNDNEKSKPISIEIQINGMKDLFKFLKANIILLVIIISSCFLVYANLINGKFLNLDDVSGIVNDPNIGNLSAAIKSMEGYNLHKVVIFKIFGLNSTAYHVIAIAMHSINSILVFLLFYVLFGKKVSLITTALFIIHPTNVEAVGWISGYPYLIRGIIIFSTLLFYSMYKKSGNKYCLWYSFAIYLLGMLFYRSSGWLFITPIILIIIDQFIFEKKIKWKNIKIYIPYIIISLIFAALVIPGFFKQRVQELQTLYYVKEETSTPLINRIPYTIYMEYKLLAFPLELSIYHEGKVLGRVEYTFMVVSTIAIISLIIYLWKKDRVLAGLMMIIILSILPSFSPIIIAWTAAERYLYIASAFYSAIVAILLLRAEDKYKVKNLTTTLTLILVLLFSIRTIFRNNDLRNSKNLWFATRKTAPYSYRVYNNLGDVYAEEKNYELAIENFKRSVALKPDYADAVHNIGYIYTQLGDMEKAKKYLTQAVDMNPRLYQSSFKLGEIFYFEKNYDKAKKYFQKCLDADPTNQPCKTYLNSMIN